MAAKQVLLCCSYWGIGIRELMQNGMMTFPYYESLWMQNSVFLLVGA